MLQAVVDEPVGVPKGSGFIVSPDVPAHADNAILKITNRKRGGTFVICKSYRLSTRFNYIILVYFLKRMGKCPNLLKRYLINIVQREKAMIFLYWKASLVFCVFIPIVLIFCSLYAYQVNEKRAPDDPEKKDFSPHSLWLAPVILPLLFLVNLIILFFSSLAFGFLLVLFPVTLILFRKPFLFKWISRQALKIGNWVLIINTELLRAAGFHPAPIKLLYERETPA
jgi:hypothetical protein